MRGVWQPQTEALFDIRVTDTDAQSYAHRTVNAVLTAAEKKRKYMHRLYRHATHHFLPLCCRWMGSWHGRLGLWCSASLLASPMVKCWAGCGVDCRSPSCGQLIGVCEGLQ